MREITRYVGRETERELWGRAAARCEFPGCNQTLYKSPVTQERVHLAQKAHIYSFAEEGPRGWGPLVVRRRDLNKIDNLLLVCHGCHVTIDRGDTVGRYSADRLRAWKSAHEERIRIVTGIQPNKKSHVILYGGKIGEESSPLDSALAAEAMFPDWYPAEEHPIQLAMSSAHEDHSNLFWSAEAEHLRICFERHIRPRIQEANPNHFSVFARASQPLLILLGALLTDKVPAEVYQLQREPISWRWTRDPENFAFQINTPESVTGPPALVISASARISVERVTSVLENSVSIWRLSTDDCHNNFLRSRAQIAAFRAAARKVIGSIAEKHGNATPLHIFPAMPVACAVELGRIRMPKADMPWVIYDQNNKAGKFISSIRIGGGNP